jgi:hypothetical protein
VRRGGVNRGGVSAGGGRISPVGFPCTRASSRHLSLVLAWRKFSPASARRACLVRNTQIERASSYRLYSALRIVRSRKEEKHGDPNCRFLLKRSRETTLRATKQAPYHCRPPVLEHVNVCFSELGHAIGQGF